MGDAMEMAMDDGTQNAQADEVYAQICDEAGIGMSFGDAATGVVGEKTAAKTEEVDDLQKRLDNLN